MTDQQCAAYKKVPASSTLKCTAANCTATCKPKHKFPKGETTLTIDCVNKAWTIKHANYKTLKELPGCLRKSLPRAFAAFTSRFLLLAVCSPACLNNGKCTAPNKCQCTKDFQGPTCKEKACKSQPPAAKNSKKSCSATQCSMTCLSNHKFKTQATVMKLHCRNGNWVSITKNLASNAQCEREWKKIHHIVTDS